MNINKTIDAVTAQSHHVRNPSNMDDNNFINNTFSFLDDLDNMNEFGSKTSLNKMIEQSKQNNATQKLPNASAHENENFPWHAIYPVADSRLE